MVLEVQEFNMITVEEKQALQSEINTAKEQIRVLQEELVAKQRHLWWAERSHIAEFENSDWYMESNDNGGNYPVFCPYGVVLSQQWLSIAGNQALIDRQLAYIAECNGDDYDEDSLRNFLICGLSTDIYCEFSDDPYPAFQDAPDTVRNPNYV
jgi:hypothetical protein